MGRWERPSAQRPPTRSLPAGNFACCSFGAMESSSGWPRMLTGGPGGGKAARLACARRAPYLRVGGGDAMALITKRKAKKLVKAYVGMKTLKGAGTVLAVAGAGFGAWKLIQA